MSTKKESKRVVATVECRMTSSRLPGKVMMESCGKPLLAHLVDRLRRVKRLDAIVLATTEKDNDDCIEQLARRLKVGCFRGSEEDVLQRVHLAAGSVQGEIIVEITGDCPLIDPDIVAQTLDLYLYNACDYAANDLFPSYPLGMDVQVFSTELLSLGDREGRTPEDREPVSWFFVRNPARFRLLMLPAPPRLYWPDLRLTLDEKEDYQLIDAVLCALYPMNPEFTCGDIIEYLSAHRELLELNRMVRQRMPGAA
jgi:spore coat polysaccharide biosynthesis protein SpsF